MSQNINFRMDSMSQLNIHHHILLPSDEGADESLGKFEQLFWFAQNK